MCAVELAGVLECDDFVVVPENARKDLLVSWIGGSSALNAAYTTWRLAGESFTSVPVQPEPLPTARFARSAAFMPPSP